MDRRPGNAAILYLDTILLMGPDSNEQADRALAAFETGDTRTFESLAGALERPALFEELDLAGRRDRCDWQPPFREMGVRTLLPHLSPLVNGIAKLVKIRALRQIEAGQVNDALATLRLGYELADNTGREPILISGMVSLRISAMMNECLVPLMNRPDAPNLYWALAELPRRRTIFSNAMDGERLASVTATIPDLARFKQGQELSAEQWRTALDSVSSLAAMNEGKQGKSMSWLATPEVMREAQQQYAQHHHVTAQETAKADPAIVLGPYYFSKFENATDDMYKLRALPYPVLLTRSRQYAADAARWVKEQPANPFLRLLPTIDRAVWDFARADREQSALTAVEALRSYAASHGGALPRRLQDVSDTPVPANPVTGGAFEYRVEEGVATIADSQSSDPLTYRVRVRR